MARIVLEAPMFDLKLSTGAWVPAAVELDDAGRADLRASVGLDFENAIRKGLEALGLFDPATRSLVANGLVVRFEDGPAPEVYDETKRVALRADGKAQACYKCRRTGVPMAFQARSYCTDCLPGARKGERAAKA